MTRIAVLASGSGTNAQRLIEHFREHPAAQVVLVGCDQPRAGVLQRAWDLHVPSYLFDGRHLREGQVLRELQSLGIGLVALAGFMRLIPTPIVRAFPGRIVNIISTSVKQPLHNLGVSNTIRGAVANWAKTLANELGPFGITVNNVLPGATETERLAAIIRNKAAKQGISEEAAAEEMRAEIPLRRFARPEEVAAAVAFLCGPSGASISGINLPVDGGRTACL
ncbi:MAG: SDR family oxidoreductase [Flavobacteriales bacterium]